MKKVLDLCIFKSNICVYFSISHLFIQKRRKTMKKLLCVLLAMIMVLSFAACGKSSDGFVPVSEGKFTVAISPDFAPMEFVDLSKTGQDQYVGFDVELAKYLASELGLELEIKPMDFGACQAAVQSKSVDCSISGFSVTDERKENFNLSDFYYAGENETQQSIIVTKDNAGKYTTADSFAGLTIGAQAASLQYNLCESQLPSSITIKQFTDLGTAVIALTEGKIDALAVAHGNGEAIMTNNENVAFSGFDFEVDDEQSNNVILMNKDSNALLALINEKLAKALEAGYYPVWYADAKELAGIETAADVSYDENGNPITDEAEGGSN